MDLCSLDEKLEIFSFMVLEDFLMRKEMKDTLRLFRKEWQRPSDDLTMLSWYELSVKLHMPQMVDSGSEEKSTLENIVNALVQESSIRSRRSPDVVCNGLAAMTKSSTFPSLKKSSYDYESNVSNDVFALTSKVEAKKDNANSNNDIKDLKNKNPISQSRSGGKLRKLKNVLSNETQLRIQKELNLMTGDKYGKGKPTVENWVPDVTRYRSVSRDLYAIKDALNDYVVRETVTMRETKKYECSDVDRAKRELELGTTKKIPCGCCQIEFFHVNLPLKVSQKAILDIRVMWSGELNSTTVFGKVNSVSNISADTKLKSVSTVDGDDAANPQSLRDLRTAARLGAVPRCYNEVLVCVFCTQFFEKQEDYRPSFEKIYYEEKKAAHFESRRREKQYWDPLDACEKYHEAAELELAMQQERSAAAAESSGIKDAAGLAESAPVEGDPTTA